MECIICIEDIDPVVKYKDKPGGEWRNSPYCSDCMEHFVSNQWFTYVSTIETETCEKTLRRMIQKGPPTHIREPVGLPCENDRGEVIEYRVGDQIKSSRLRGVYEGQEMTKYKTKLQTILIGLEN